MNETQEIFAHNAGFCQPSTSGTKSTSAQVNLENVQDFSNVCRTCATITEFVIPIFAGEGLQNNLADKIHTHLPIKVTEADALPRVVCYQCASTLLAWHELVACCRHADAALRTRLAADPSLQTDKEPKPSNSKTSSTSEEDAQSKSFYINVQNVIIDYFPNLNIKDNLDVEFVCQKCMEKPMLSTVESLSNHLKYDHNSDVNDEKSIKTFIKNYVTFEEALDSEDSDRDDQSDVVTEKALPNLFCPFCSSVFTSPTRLLCHLNKHFEVCIENGTKCCDVVYSDKKIFIKHLQDAHVDRIVEDTLKVCKCCGFTAENVDQLQLHINKRHVKKIIDREKKLQSPLNQKYIPAVCPECNKTFSNKYAMFVHMKNHSGDVNLYSCEKCNKTYKNRQNLNNHVKLVHEGMLNVLCSECGEAFPTRTARDVHARLHSGLKPYKCDYCGKCYRAKNTLDRHIEIHLDIRKYECQICSKKFRKKTHLDYHIKTHSK